MISTKKSGVYIETATGSHFDAYSHKGLKKELEGLGYPASRTKTSRLFVGLAITAQPQTPAATRTRIPPSVLVAPQSVVPVKPVVPPASSPVPPAVAGGAQPGAAAQTNGSAPATP